MTAGRLDLVDAGMLARAGPEVSASVAERVARPRRPTPSAPPDRRDRLREVVPRQRPSGDARRRRHVRRYTSHLRDRKLAPSTVLRAQTAIRKLHEESGHPDLTPAKPARDVLLGYRRLRAEAGRSWVTKATPIGQKSLPRRVETCDGGTAGTAGITCCSCWAGR